ncbi:MAG TPA: potassium/proton antiporter, partial [Alphaproteobacteria bacterium]|nr:potassium/proton antiporter [Alphaproteobacteria bacterium]
GGIAFGDFNSAYLIGSMALAIILFDGGLRTPMASIRAAWRPAAVLASIGVLVTAAATGVAFWLAAGGALLQALLIGAIVASTDAAAVFLLLHQRGMELRRRVNTTLEVESGVNDPMAIFLTVTLTALIAAAAPPLSWEPVRALALQLGLGAVLGVGAGMLLAFLVNRLELAAGLYPVFVVAGALALFGGTQSLGGSGFLAVYLAGIVAGNQRLRANRLIRRFHDGFAWVGQIVLFVMLGLLVSPHRLLDDLVPGLIVAGVLTFLARPLAVLSCLLPFRFPPREIAFVAWVGLRGAVPIFLAIIPVLGGLPHAAQYFNVAFIVVLASLLLQGWTVPWVARLLDVELPPRPEPEGRLDVDLPSQMDRDVIGYRVRESSPAAHRPIDGLPLPRRGRIIAVLRDNAVVPRQRWDVLRSDDYVLAIAPPESTVLLDRLFLPRRPARRPRREIMLGDFVFPASVPMAALGHEYGLPLPPSARGLSAAEFLRQMLSEPISAGDQVRLGEAALVVREMIEDEIREVGLRLAVADEAVPAGWRGRLERWLRPA